MGSESAQAEACGTQLTPPGRGAVATIRLEGGPQELSRALNLCRAKWGRPLSERRVDEIVFVQWGIEAAEDVVMARVAEDAWEVHGHGGRAAVSRILSDLQSVGIRTVTEASRGAGSRDVGAPERQSLLDLAWHEVSRASTLRTADLLLHQADVAWPRLLASDRPDTATLSAWADFGLHLTRPWRVALCGRPNAGKSSLMNALAGYERSIVHEQPGTTRDAITLETALEGWPVQLIDTAGLREAGDVIEREGIQRAREAAAGADLVLLVMDASQPATSEDGRLLSAFPSAIRVWNKSDLGTVWQADTRESASVVSARTGAGLEELIDGIVNSLVPLLPEPGQAVPLCPEHLAWVDRMRGVRIR